MKYIASALCMSLSLVAMAKTDKRPNIVLFLVDDMGWQDTSLPFWKDTTDFNRRYHTPNMERLAKDGKMFTQAYACSISSPTRCSLISGMNAARHRVTNWTLYKDVSREKPDPEIELPKWNVNGVCMEEGIPYTARITPLAEILKENGYHTILCGKSHFGAIDTPGADPKNLGFEVNIAGHAAGGPASYYPDYGNTPNGEHQSVFAVPGLQKYYNSNVFLTEALTREALSSLDTMITKKDPFFLYMSHYAVHVPINPDMRFYQKYLDKGLDKTEAGYATLVEGMDKSLGDILDYLKKHNLEDNTIVIFMSDNGGLSAAGRGGIRNMHNLPLKSGKGSAYEGGVREPMIVKWPGVVKPNTKTDSYLIIEDFFPTILDMANIKHYNTVQKVDGKSFMPLLKGHGCWSKNRALYWNCPNLWDCKGPGIGATCTIRKGDWKLIYYYRTSKKELYNIKNDIGEHYNLAKENPRIVKRLSKDLGEFLRSVDAQRPYLKKQNRYCPWPDECL